MQMNLKPWPLDDLCYTLGGVMVVVFIAVFALSQWLAPSSVVAGCSVAFIGRYLVLNGASFHKGALRSRLAFLATLILVAVVTGGIGTLAFGR